MVLLLWVSTRIGPRLAKLQTPVPRPPAVVDDTGRRRTMVARSEKRKAVEASQIAMAARQPDTATGQQRPRRAAVQTCGLRLTEVLQRPPTALRLVTVVSQRIVLL